MRLFGLALANIEQNPRGAGEGGVGRAHIERCQAGTMEECVGTNAGNAVPDHNVGQAGA